jgi:ElaB/YqjD/DUF883 family membrane-anchored ribosome-binding protein
MDKPEATNSSSNAFNRGVDSASGTMHRAIDSASEAASPAIKNMAASAHSTVDKMASGANYAADVIVTKGTQLNHMQKQLTDGALSKVRSHPLLSLGIAVAGGALLSYWLRRRAAGKEVV